MFIFFIFVDLLCNYSANKVLLLAIIFLSRIRELWNFLHIIVN